MSDHKSETRGAVGSTALVGQSITARILPFHAGIRPLIRQLGNRVVGGMGMLAFDLRCLCWRIGMVWLKWRLYAGVYAKCLKHGQFYLSMRFPRVKKCQYFIKLFSDVHDVIWPNDQAQRRAPEGTVECTEGER